MNSHMDQTATLFIIIAGTGSPILAGLTLNGTDVTHTHAHMGSAHNSSNTLSAIGGSSSNLSAAGLGGGSRVNSSSALNELGKYSVYPI